MARVIAVANMKGGVGKTATVVSLAETLAAKSIDLAVKGQGRAKSVLVIDLDAQASASFALAGDDRLLGLIRQGHTLDGFLDRFLVVRQEVDLASLVTRDISDVSHRNEPLKIGLLASSPRLRIVERHLIHSLTKGGYSLERVEHDFFKLLSGQFLAVERDYDYVIFDCPPGISVLTEIALRLAELTVVPTIPDFLSLLGLDAFTQNVWARLSKSTLGLPAPRRKPEVLVTLRRPIPAHDRKVEDLRRRARDGRAEFAVFRTEIPDAEGVPEALERVTTFPNYAQKWSSDLRAHLSDLVDEIDAVLETAS